MAHRHLPLMLRRILCMSLLCAIAEPPFAPVSLAQSAAGAATPAHSGRSAISVQDEAAFENAMHLLDSGQVKEAQATLERLHREHPDTYEITESLGLLYATAGDLARALPLLQHGARLRPADATGHANLGTAYLKLGQTDLAVSELGRAAQLDPGNPETASALGQALVLAHQPCKAADAFTLAEQHAPAQSDDLAYNTGLALFECGRYDEAAGALARMPGLNASAPAQLLLADTEEKTKHFQTAAEHYLRAAQLEPSEANLYALGEDLLRHWSFDPAIKTFETGVARFPQSRRMQTGLGIAYYGAARYTDAIGVFSGLLDVDPSSEVDAEIFGRACTVLTASDDPRCARLETLAHAHPANANLNLYAAMAILQQPAQKDRLETAAKFLNSAIQADPGLAPAYYQSGVVLQQKNDWQGSIAPLQKAVALDPQLASAHYHLGLAYNRLGRKDDATKEMLLSRNEGEQQRNDLNARMQQITTLLVKTK